MTSTLSSRAPRRDALENREAIVLAASAVFRRDPEASLDAVAGEAGLSRRALYGHFSSRDELLAELLTRGGARISTALADVQHADPRIHLALIGAAIWAEVQQVRVLAQLALHGPLEKTVADALSPVRASVRRATRAGVEQGWFRASVPVETLAHLIEDAAIGVLDEAVRGDLGYDEGRRLVMTVGLSVAGLSWRDADALVESIPAELLRQPEAAEGSSVERTGEVSS
ncbi:TetR/AcrR family transcriptional regulator [Herbiconiux liangxiaofengii]|uniref:TetR/AcrR family transcriptional regulator n=1 Tax=Herbiconiux liangxiaofengii TaxID=3342795 RepID=UPI0035BAD42B